MIWTGFDRQFNRLNRNQLNRRSRQCRTKSNSHLFRWLKTRNAPKLYLKQQYLKKQLINKYLHFIQCLQIMDYNFVHQTPGQFPCCKRGCSGKRQMLRNCSAVVYRWRILQIFDFYSEIFSRILSNKGKIFKILS